MLFAEIELKGACLVEPEFLADDRGFFARTYCADEFKAHGLKAQAVQCNISFNRKRGTLRGMHFQNAPHAEAKLVRCTRGAILDVIIDLRGDSPTYMQWRAFELTGENRAALYIPEGMAHGFQTLEDDTEVFYQMYSHFVPASAAGVRWDDLAFDIRWPIADPILSDKDRSYADFDGFSL